MYNYLKNILYFETLTQPPSLIVLSVCLKPNLQSVVANSFTFASWINSINYGGTTTIPSLLGVEVCSKHPGWIHPYYARPGKPHPLSPLLLLGRSAEVPPGNGGVASSLSSQLREAHYYGRPVIAGHGKMTWNVCDQHISYFNEAYTSKCNFR